MRKMFYLWASILSFIYHPKYQGNMRTSPINGDELKPGFCNQIFIVYIGIFKLRKFLHTKVRIDNIQPIWTD